MSETNIFTIYGTDPFLIELKRDEVFLELKKNNFFLREIFFNNDKGEYRTIYRLLFEIRSRKIFSFIDL